MKTALHFAVLLLVLNTTSARAQNGSDWLRTINRNAIDKAKDAQTFAGAPHGLSLYFSQAGSIRVPYLVYVPASYKPAAAAPVLVFLHGAILARDSFQYKDPAIAQEPIFYAADEYNAIVVFPFARSDFKWAGKAVQPYENVINIIRQVEERYNVDKDRVYIGGMSMGGNATFWFVNNKPTLFAGFYTFSAYPSEGEVNFSVLTKNKPLVSINSKDDQTFPYNEVAAVYEQHKKDAPGWTFLTAEIGGHRFIYAPGGAKYVKSVLGKLLR